MQHKKYILWIFCAITLLTQLISLGVLVKDCRDSFKYGSLLTQLCNKTLFFENSPDGKYTVRLCENVLVCSNNVSDTQYVDIYCMLNGDISRLNVDEKNIVVEWKKDEMKIKFDYSYSNDFNLFYDNKFTVTVPYSDFT